MDNNKINGIDVANASFIMTVNVMLIDTSIGSHRIIQRICAKSM